MNQAEFNTFLQLLPDAALLLREGGVVHYASPRALALLERSEGELLGQAFSSFWVQPGESVSASSLSAQDESQLLRVRGRNEGVLFLEASVRAIEMEGESLLLALLRERKGPDVSGEADVLRHHLAVDTWDIGLYEHNHLTDEIYSCSRVRELYCLKKDELLTIQIFAGSLHPEDFDRAIAEIMKAHDPEGDGRFDVFHRIVRHDTTVRWIHTRAKTTFGLVNGEMAPVLTTGSIMDMTARQELKLELQKREERLTMATVAAEVGILEIDYAAAEDNGGKEEVYWSRSLRTIGGVTADFNPTTEWYIGQIPLSDRASAQQAMAAVLDPKRRGHHEIEHRYVRPDASVRWLTVRASATFDSDSDEARPLRLVGVVLDTTERKAVEEDRARRTAILDATPDFVCITDPQGSITYLNHAGRSFLGIGKDEELGGRAMAPVHPPDVLALINEVGLPSAKRDGAWTAETVFLRHDAVEIPMSQVLLVHKDAKGVVVFHSTIARDLSRERELEEQFRQAQKMEAVGRLAGGIAHDFNNLLSVIMGFAEIAGDRIKKGTGGAEELDEIQRAGARAAALTGQLLAFSRKQILNPESIDINEILRGIVSMFQRLVDESIELTVSPGTGTLRTKADPHQVEQILLNLVVNARDAMPKGGHLSVEASRVTLDEASAASRLDLEPGDYVVLAVSDTGTGMDAETREKIFEPFFTTKEPGKGTGLGLSTVFGIVRQSGGGIWVYSEPGLGTTFKVYFPCTEEEPKKRPQSQGPVNLVAAGEVILVTEDEPQLRRMITSVLSRAGYSVLSASGPVDALGTASDYSGTIDLLLTDVVMPNMSGRELAEQLVQTRPSTSVLYMSGYTEDSIVHHGVLDEGINFIPKPITPKLLLAAVVSLLQERKRSQ